MGPFVLSLWVVGLARTSGRPSLLTLFRPRKGGLITVAGTLRMGCARLCVSVQNHCFHFVFASFRRFSKIGFRPWTTQAGLERIWRECAPARHTAVTIFRSVAMRTLRGITLGFAAREFRGVPEGAHRAPSVLVIHGRPAASAGRLPCGKCTLRWVVFPLRRPGSLPGFRKASVCWRQG